MSLGVDNEVVTPLYMLVSWIIFGIDSSDEAAVASTWSPTILKADCMWCPTTGGGGGVTPGWLGGG